MLGAQNTDRTWAPLEVISTSRLKAHLKPPPAGLPPETRLSCMN